MIYSYNTFIRFNSLSEPIHNPV